MQILLFMQKAFRYRYWRRLENVCKTACCLNLVKWLTSEAKNALSSGNDGDNDDDDDDQGHNDNRDDGSTAGFWKVKCQQKVFCHLQMCWIIMTVWRKLVTKQTDYQTEALHQVQSCAVTRANIGKESFKRRIIRIRTLALFGLMSASVSPLGYFEGVLAANRFLFG